jgi:hypothetical protein
VLVGSIVLIFLLNQIGCRGDESPTSHEAPPLVGRPMFKYSKKKSGSGSSGGRKPRIPNRRMA